MILCCVGATGATGGDGTGVRSATGDSSGGTLAGTTTPGMVKDGIGLTDGITVVGEMISGMVISGITVLGEDTVIYGIGPGTCCDEPSGGAATSETMQSPHMDRISLSSYLEPHLGQIRIATPTFIHWIRYLNLIRHNPENSCKGELLVISSSCFC